MAGKSSGTLRRAIGLAKSFLVEKLEDQKKDSKEDVTKFDEEELVEFLKQTHQDHEQIRIQVEKIQGYEDEWDQMILRDPREVEVKANYITKYGSYMAQVEAGHKQMQDMEAKYREAWDRLNAKDEKLPDITNSTSPAALQEFYINAQMIFNELMSLGCEMDNLSTADAIESKLPFRVVRKAYTQGCRDTPYKASELLEMVGKISRSESLLAAIKPTNEQRTTTMAVQNRHGQGKNSMNNRQKEKVKKPCKYCVEERMMHHPMDCRKYATNEERKVRAGQLQLCFKCLEAGHVARDCSWKCKECQGKHHFTMCHKREQQGQGRQQHPRNAGHSLSKMNFSINRFFELFSHSNKRANILLTFEKCKSFLQHPRKKRKKKKMDNEGIEPQTCDSYSSPHRSWARILAEVKNKY
ncbi:Protein CBG03374 [Caenorhabditis briggsae]|uniref:Protein CBG03374 n=1 Tax=Caenorhabditis briggsae TaxID=6238 RepID=A8WUW4_CAEBR|nr:Protein CBG03374 [Caenorhabditis briggsae]CAP24275.2 Protein CBG03374 [Caenorhabditis briggsae]